MAPLAPLNPPLGMSSADDGVRYGEGVSHSPLSSSPPQKNCLTSERNMAHFGAFWVIFCNNLKRLKLYTDCSTSVYILSAMRHRNIVKAFVNACHSYLMSMIIIV